MISAARFYLNYTTTYASILQIVQLALNFYKQKLKDKLLLLSYFQIEFERKSDLSTVTFKVYKIKISHLTFLVPYTTHSHT